jgi:hypothetical protein
MSLSDARPSRQCHFSADEVVAPQARITSWIAVPVSSVRQAHGRPRRADQRPFTPEKVSTPVRLGVPYPPRDEPLQRGSLGASS